VDKRIKMPKQPITPSYHIIYPIKVAKSKIAGFGAYALRNIPARKKIGDLGGVIITMKEAKKLIRNLKVINMVELDDNLALNASANPNDIRFINHSCGPNTYMRVMKDRVEFYALRNIKKGEELSCDYGETHHEGKLPCRCGSKNCKGFI
jgi:SET domain-containing protein